ncbi:MAG: hypothetical protein NTV46_20445 [Verrucomicrobia bacterium]|nr:hypothetical protein [Verrucomicrobiota bacterium]
MIGGFGTGATGLGLGCARVHGDHRRAGMLGAEMIATSVPLPGDTLLVPRLVSDREHAPYFAEQVILHQLSMLPMQPPVPAPRAPLPLVVWLILAFETMLLGLLLRLCAHLILPAKPPPPPPPTTRTQAPNTVDHLQQVGLTEPVESISTRHRPRKVRSEIFPKMPADGTGSNCQNPRTASVQCLLVGTAPEQWGDKQRLSSTAAANLS